MAVGRADTDNPSVVVVLRPLTASVREIRLRRDAAEPVFVWSRFCLVPAKAARAFLLIFRYEPVARKLPQENSWEQRRG